MALDQYYDYLKRSIDKQLLGFELNTAKLIKHVITFKPCTPERQYLQISAAILHHFSRLIINVVDFKSKQLVNEPGRTLKRSGHC